jgi:plasmid stabilization system protein ParE
MTIRYSPAAREDLRALRRYLVDEFGAAVADRSVQKIVSDIALVKQQPNLLRPLADKIGRVTGYKYFLCGRYSIAIIEHAPRVISVLRILDGRTDYCTTIFGN